MSSETELLRDDTVAPPPKAPWVTAITSSRNPARLLPQAIAHRGYKALFPENSMSAFEGAVSVGAHAVETDLHMSSDGVVVLSHDPSLKRCFGVDKKIRDCTWEYLSGLETLREPREGMPRLLDLLRWMGDKGKEDIWVLLDVKVPALPSTERDAKELLVAVKRTLDAVPGGAKLWEERIILGLWNATFIRAARQILPSYPAVLITWHLPYAGHFFDIPNLGFNIARPALTGWCGSRFLRRARDADRPVFAWTVNEERWMEWCIRKNADATGSNSSSSSDPDGVEGKEEDDGRSNLPKRILIDGVITDDPKLFLEVCERWEDEQDSEQGKEKEKEKEMEMVTAKRSSPGLGSSVGSMAYNLAAPAVMRLFFLYGWWKGKFDYFKDVTRLERW